MRPRARMKPALRRSMCGLAFLAVTCMPAFIVWRGLRVSPLAWEPETPKPVWSTAHSPGVSCVTAIASSHDKQRSWHARRRITHRQGSTSQPPAN
jgi:hypothetical protein